MRILRWVAVAAGFLVFFAAARLLNQPSWTSLAAGLTFALPAAATLLVFEKGYLEARSVRRLYIGSMLATAVATGAAALGSFLLGNTLGFITSLAGVGFSCVGLVAGLIRERI